MTVGDLAGRHGVLAGHAAGGLALLGDAGLVDDKDRVRLGERLDRIVAHRVAQGIRIPPGPAEQRLPMPRARITRGFWPHLAGLAPLGPSRNGPAETATRAWVRSGLIRPLHPRAARRPTAPAHPRPRHPPSPPPDRAGRRIRRSRQDAPVIPTALGADRFGPLAAGDRGEPAGRRREPVPRLAAGRDDGLVVGPDPQAELVLAQVLPDVLARVQTLWGGRRG
jgi:hypothetical protein